MRRSIRICKGVNVNFGKTGTSLSFGSRGFRQTIHPSGRRTTSVGIPGTGISYVKSTGGRSSGRGKSRSSVAPVASQQQQQSKQQQKQAEIDYNISVVNDFDYRIEYIKSIHRYCDDYVDWSAVRTTPAPFNPESAGPRQAAAIYDYENFKPSITEKVFKGKADKRQLELYAAIDSAAKEDAEDYFCWENSVRLANDVLKGEIEAYFFVINEMRPFEKLLEFGSEFEVGADSMEEMEVEFKVKSETVVPKQSVSMTKTGKLSIKELTKTAYFDFVQDYVCSTTIRVARDLFAILPAQSVIVHAVDDILNTATGHMNEETILSVRFNREMMNRINFAAIDPSDAMNNFEHKMRFAKTAGFKSVERLQ